MEGEAWPLCAGSRDQSCACSSSSNVTGYRIQQHSTVNKQRNVVLSAKHQQQNHRPAVARQCILTATFRPNAINKARPNCQRNLKKCRRRKTTEYKFRGYFIVQICKRPNIYKFKHKCICSHHDANVFWIVHHLTRSRTDKKVNKQHKEIKR